MKRVEAAFIERLRADVAAEAASVPTGADAFLVWLEDLVNVGPGQSDPLFPWLAEIATQAGLRWFFE